MIHSPLGSLFQSKPRSGRKTISYRFFFPDAPSFPMDPIEYIPIGIMHTPYTDSGKMPIQPTGARGIPGEIEIEPQFIPALDDLEGFSRIIVLYHFHRSRKWSLRVIPFLDTQPRGLFATRAPSRPNPIGISIIRLTGIEGSLIRVMDVDILDGTPVLDIKPYIPDFDSFPDERIGWMTKRSDGAARVISDDRFSPTDRS
jgi:tRNA-Thr(GGU) m(6)t(6)A37 methyltransferase TsaA